MGNHPFKTFNKRLSVVLGRPQGSKPLNVFRTIKSCPFKVSKPKSSEKVGPKTTWVISTLEVGLERPPNQPGANSAYGHVVLLWELVLSQLQVRLRLSFDNRV